MPYLTALPIHLYTPTELAERSMPLNIRNSEAAPQAAPLLRHFVMECLDCDGEWEAFGEVETCPACSSREIRAKEDE